MCAKLCGQAYISVLFSSRSIGAKYRRTHTHSQTIHTHSDLAHCQVIIIVIRSMVDAIVRFIDDLTRKDDIPYVTKLCGGGDGDGGIQHHILILALTRSSSDSDIHSCNISIVC